MLGYAKFQDMKPFVIACIPAYNEEATIAKVIVCDDGSRNLTDGGCILLLTFKGRRVLDHAEETGDMIIHYDRDGGILMVEIPNASKVVPKLVEAMAKKKVSIATG